VSNRTEVQPLPAWLAWPVRALAVVFVLPFRLAWEALGLLWRYVGAPLVEHVIQPLLYYVIWLPLRWVTVHLLWTPLVWITVHILAPVCSALWKALRPVGRVLGRALLQVARAVGWALGLAHRYVLAPIGRAIAFVWRRVVAPVARAIGSAVAWAWNHSVALLWRYLVVIPLVFVWRYLVVIPLVFVWRYLVVIPLVFVWRYLVVIPLVFVWRYLVLPPARWVRTWVLRPVADTTRRVLVTLGLRAAPPVRRSR
jgi:hypothetical protein